MANEFLKLLPLELQSVENLEDVMGEVPGEVVGEMPIELRQLYTLWIGMRKAHDQAEVDRRYKPDDEELRAKEDEYEDKATALWALLIVGIKEEFQLWGKVMGLTKGNKVVMPTLPPPSGPQDFFRRMFGGG